MFTSNTDIRKAKRALESLKVYDSKIVKVNIALLEEAFFNLNSAQTVPLTEEEMTYYIQEKLFCLDGRISIQSVMATSKAGKFPYSQIFRALIELDPPIVSHKMSALVGEKEICRNNLA